MLQDRGSLSAISISAINEKCYKIINDRNMKKMFGDIYSSHWFSNPDADKDPLLMPHTWPECQEYMAMIRTKTQSPVSNSWFNITPTGGSSAAHIHPKAKETVFVFYSKLDSSHPSIEFLENDIWVPLTCNQGEWIQFGTTDLHRVPENTSKEDRIAIMINI